ncbi:hypothetical protein [Kribbella swartbergensis]
MAVCDRPQDELPDREDATPFSDLPRSLLTLTAHVYDGGAGQPPINGVEIDEEANEAARAEEEAVLRELEGLGQVATVGFASNLSRADRNSSMTTATSGRRTGRRFAA